MPRSSSASTRERILAAAERLFAERGYERVSMPVIAAASGITAGAIYRHFPGKAQLFFEIVRRAVESQDEAAAGDGLGARVAAFSSRPMKRLRQLAVEMHYAAGKDPAVRRLLGQSITRQVGELEVAIAAGVEGRRAEARFSARAAMIFIMGLMHLDTLAPELIDDPAWSAWIGRRLERLLSP